MKFTFFFVDKHIAMLTELYGAVQRITKRPIAHHNISGGGFRFPARITEVFHFLTKLSPHDLDIFKQRATFSIENPNQDERSTVIPLENPIEIEGRTILALRLKGIFPRTAENGQVQAYKEGKGFVEKILKVVGKDLICSDPKKSSVEYSAQGSMRFTKLKTEVETALQLGGELTDFLLGFGIFEGLEFDGQPIGFAIYGMERKEDLRVQRYFHRRIKETGSLDNLQELASSVGKVLRKIHQQNLVHRYPHLGNFGLSLPNHCRVLDLDTTFALSSVPAEWRPALLYLDLSRTINDLMRSIRYEDIYDGEAEIADVFLTPLIPFFLHGYFVGDAGLLLSDQIARFILPGAPAEDLFRTFGYCPEFDSNWRLGGNDHSLMEPTIHALQVSPEPVNLKDPRFMRTPLYAVFYAALEAIRF